MVKYWRVIVIGISALLLWGWLLTPIASAVSTADSPAAIQFEGKTESSSNQHGGDNQFHVTEASKASSSMPTKSDVKQPERQATWGWLPQTNEQWWLSAFIGGIGLLMILISCQLITYLKKRSLLR